MNYEQMVKDIDALVETDFTEEMYIRSHFPHGGTGQKLTQEQAKRMTEIIANIYSIAHQIHCEGCRNSGKYLIK